MNETNKIVAAILTVMKAPKLTNPTPEWCVSEYRNVLAVLEALEGAGADGTPTLPRMNVPRR